MSKCNKKNSALANIHFDKQYITYCEIYMILLIFLFLKLEKKLQTQNDIDGHREFKTLTHKKVSSSIIIYKTKMTCDFSLLNF